MPLGKNDELMDDIIAAIPYIIITIVITYTWGHANASTYQ
jgi:hypothetical protein